MLPFSYTVTAGMTDDLTAIDGVRRDILLTVLNPNVAMQHAWETRLARLEYALLLSGRRLSRKQILSHLAQSGIRSDVQGTALFLLRYKEVLHTLRTRWIMQPQMPSAADLHALAARLRLGPDADRAAARFDRAFSYIHSGDIHPVVAAAIVSVAAYDILGFTGPAGCITRIASFLVLNRAGYDCGGFPVWERFWWDDRDLLEAHAKASFREERCTVWLETFIKGILKEATAGLHTIRGTAGDHAGTENLLHITARQQHILAAFDQPGERITNRNIKKRFGISQITASRDLAALARFGLLFSHGKGRSVYYTRVG